MAQVVEANAQSSLLDYSTKIMAEDARVNRPTICIGEYEVVQAEDAAEFQIQDLTLTLVFSQEAGQQPDGICLDSTLLENAVTTAATGAVTVEDFLDMIYACPAKHRKHGSFVVHSFTELALRKLRARGGR